MWVPESPPSRDPNATPLMEEVQKSGGTECFDTSPWQREPREPPLGWCAARGAVRSSLDRQSLG